MRWPCALQPRKWGSGKYPADLAVALPGCRRCPRDAGECLSDFAAKVDPKDSAGMVVAGLHGTQLRRAMKNERHGRAA